MRYAVAAGVVGLLAAPAGAQTVEVGRADWSALPRIENAREIPMAGLVGRVEEMLRSKACTLSGQTADRFDITVPYAILLEPDGSTKRVVVAETGCTPLETMVGEVALLRARSGHFRPARGGKARWYAHEINFTLE